MIDGWRCAVCAATVGIDEPLVWQCPNRTVDDPHHVLHLHGSDDDATPLDDPNPFVRYGPRLAWWAFAGAHGLTVDERVALTREVADGFSITPFGRSEALSDEIGVEIWVKDETGQVAGSQKGRHLLSILLHLRAAEHLAIVTDRRPLAIASCGNAAMAAATLANRAGWPIDVYVPTWMDESFGRRLDELGAVTHSCERRDTDPPGDPAMFRFREAVAGGSIPFSVQGPENAWCLDGGRTLGWELADQADRAGVTLDRVVVQVGGGAFAASVGSGLGPGVRLDTVQAEGCAPLAAAWARARPVASPSEQWAEMMQPWPDPHSAADGILDDETYDWLADLDVMRASRGHPIVASEATVIRAHDLATAAGFEVSVTGSAGLAGVLAVRDDLRPDERIAVIMSGASRS
ncbi:MAG: PLP-dependent lyase/thiolase [Ilumatobacter sp.]